jgi:hypothetical protein
MPRNTSSRRSFLTNTAKTGLALGWERDFQTPDGAGDHFHFRKVEPGYLPVLIKPPFHILTMHWSR